MKSWYYRCMMKVRRIPLSLLFGTGMVIAVWTCSLTLFAARRSTQPSAVIGYVFPQNHLLQPGEVAVQKLTRINYAFANIKDGRIVEGLPTDAANFATLNAQRKQNPSLTILVSVGGWLWSGNFSDAVLTEQSRKVFIDSVVAFIERYNLDGLDIDWEYPGQIGAGNRFRSEDKQNYTAVLRELRQRFDQEQKKLHRRLYLTIAAGSNQDWLDHTDMSAVARYVDDVDVMAYDYYEPGDEPTTGHNAPLFLNPSDPKQVSADRSVRAFEQAGVPARKIVLGVPFYGHEWGQVPPQNHGLFQPGKPVPGAFATYSNIADNMLNATGPDQGFVRYWDAASQVPYVYNANSHIFISYDDPQSMALKCRYVLRHHLAGIMFWDYQSDTTGALLNTVDASLLHQKSAAKQTKFAESGK